MLRTVQAIKKSDSNVPRVSVDRRTFQSENAGCILTDS